VRRDSASDYISIDTTAREFLIIQSGWYRIDFFSLFNASGWGTIKIERSNTGMVDYFDELYSGTQWRNFSVSAMAYYNSGDRVSVSTRKDGSSGANYVAYDDGFGTTVGYSMVTVSYVGPGAN
jgi:hypothetical protein